MAALPTSLQLSQSELSVRFGGRRSGVPPATLTPVRCERRGRWMHEHAHARIRAVSSRTPRSRGLTRFEHHRRTFVAVGEADARRSDFIPTAKQCAHTPLCLGREVDQDGLAVLADLTLKLPYIRKFGWVLAAARPLRVVHALYVSHWVAALTAVRTHLCSHHLDRPQATRMPASERE